MKQLIKIDSLLQKEVSRKEFLQYIGLALLAFIGVTNLIKNLHSSFSGDQHRKIQSSGYGNSVYGR